MLEDSIDIKGINDIDSNITYILPVASRPPFQDRACSGQFHMQ